MKLLITILFLFSSISTCLADAQSDFQHGVEQYREKQYNTAIQFFESAKNQGLNTAALYHNLAICYFKLDKLTKAEQYFRLARQFPDMEMLAEYNLGLVALNRKQKQTALKFFKNVAQQAKNKKLSQRAQQQIRNLTENITKAWSAYTELAYGYDDNITTIDEISTKGTGSFRDIYISGDAVLAGNYSNGLLVDAFYLETRYPDWRNYDFQLYSIGAHTAFTTYQWKNSLGISSRKSISGHLDYQRINNFEMKTKRDLSTTSSLRVRYRYDDIESLNDSYPYLSGWRQRLRAGYRYNNDVDKLKFYYEIEHNDRQDEADEATVNHSPNRYKLYLRYSRALKNGIGFGASLSYRLSVYRRIGTATVARDEAKTKASLKLSYKMNPVLTLTAKHTYTRNNTSDSVNQYQRNVSILSLEADF